MDCGSFTKHCERIQKFKEACDLNYVYRNKLDKTSFAHDAVYSNSKDLAKRTISDIILKDRAYEIAVNRNCSWYQRGLASLVFKFFDKKIGADINVNEVLAQELHKSVIKKFKRIKVCARFKDNIWALDLAEKI